MTDETQKTRHTDYSDEMPHLDFAYDEHYFPSESELPDPQVNPTLPGARVALQKVGVGPVELPVILKRRDGTTCEVYAKTSLYGSLDDPYAKGLNFSRFYITIHEALEGHISVDGIKQILKQVKDKQGCKDAYCKMQFHYKWTQEAPRSRKELPVDAPDELVWKIIDGKKLSFEKKWGHIFYDCTVEGRIDENDQYRFFLSVKYRYSSTCPCSYTLAQSAMINRGKAANGHSQRSVATMTIELDSENPVWIEDVVELARRQIPTEVIVYCKRVDEQAFAEKNGSNLLFTEDSTRLLYEGLDSWFDEGKIKDFSIVTVHEESLHPYNAIAVAYKGIANGLR